MVETETAMAEVDTEGKKEEKKFFNTEKIVLIAGAIIILIVFGIISITKWALVDQPFFGGIFNTSFWGVPLYIFFVPLAMLAYFCAWAYWAHLQWDLMAPFHGLWIALQGHSEVIFKTDLNLNFILKSERGASLVFDHTRYDSLVEHKFKILTSISRKLRPVDQSVDFANFLQGSWESKPIVNVGSVPASVLLDANGWTKDVSPERTAIAEECDKFNDLNQNDQIHSLAKAWDYMDKGILDTPKNVKLYVTIPWVRVDNAYPKERNASSWGGFVRQLAEVIASHGLDKGISMTTVGIIVFIACLGISAMMFVMKLMTNTATVAH